MNLVLGGARGLEPSQQEGFELLALTFEALCRVDHERSPEGVDALHPAPAIGARRKARGLPPRPSRRSSSVSTGTRAGGSSAFTVTRKTSSVRVFAPAEVANAPPRTGRPDQPGNSAPVLGDRFRDEAPDHRCLVVAKRDRGAGPLGVGDGRGLLAVGGGHGALKLGHGRGERQLGREIVGNLDCDLEHVAKRDRALGIVRVHDRLRARLVVPPALMVVVLVRLKNGWSSLTWTNAVWLLSAATSGFDSTRTCPARIAR